MKKILKKLIPKKILNLRHLFFAWYGAVKYKHPSEELLVIGITGTSGKSTTAYLLRQLLESSGFIVGSLSTIDFYVAGQDKLNDTKMTMLGKTAIQKYLREMVNKKCDIAYPARQFSISLFTKPSASPSFCNCNPIIIEEFFFFLIASVGESVINIFSGA